MNKEISFFIASMGDGGAQRVVSLLSREFADREYSVSLLTYYDIPPSYDIDERVNCICIEKETKDTNIFKSIRWLHRYMKENKGIMISFLAPFNMIAVCSSFFTKTKIFVADRNDPRCVPENILLRFVRNILYACSKGVIVQTDNNKQYFPSIIKKKTVVIYNPVDLKEYKGVSIGTIKQKQIVSVGRLVKQKNQELMIRAFKRVLDVFPEYKLVIWGEGDNRANLEALIKNEGLGESVFLPGKTNNVFNNIKDAEVFVLSSNYEGMPNALIEAMCLGLPVISTDVSGANDLIENRQNGIIVEKCNEEELANAIIEVISNKELSDRISNNALETNNILNSDRITKDWINLIENNNV